MNLRPKISIIMPVYNAEHRLSISIESVLNQTYNNIELLLINDGSTDSSSKICEYYVKKDERVKVFHQVNSGVSSARNRGLMEATGDYITFVDSDDTVDKEIYKEVVYKINSTDPDLVVFGMTFEYHKFNEIVKSKVMSFDIDETIESKQLVDYFFKLFKKNYLSPIWNKIIRTSIIRKYGLKFEEEMAILEDLKFTLDILDHVSKIVVLKASYYNYYNDLTTSSLSRRPNINYFSNFNILDDRLRSFSSSNGILDSQGAGEINCMIFRFYLIGIEKLFSSSLNIKEKFAGLNNYLSNDKVKKAANSAKCQGVRIKLVQYLTKKNRVYVIFIMFILNDLIRSMKKFKF